MKPAIHKPDAGHFAAGRAISTAEDYNFVCKGFKYILLGHIAQNSGVNSCGSG